MIDTAAEAMRHEKALLKSIVDGGQPSFAFLHRRESTGPDHLEVVAGPVSSVAALADLPLPGPGLGPDGDTCHDLLAVVPFRQIGERGFSYLEDYAPLLVMKIDRQATLPVDWLIAQIPDTPLAFADAHFDIEDTDYADIVREVLRDEIGRGEGSNFVIKRSFVAQITNYSMAAALAVFSRLLTHENGAYWVFLVHTGSETFIGATPERHVSMSGDTVVMNPISGTYRYPVAGPTLPGVLEFLTDRKETDELCMVVDEELKMMTRLCGPGVKVEGPRLKEMTKLAHTEYVLRGRSSADVRRILRETMFSPAVTGSPLESACRAITRHEPEGRGYYAGVLALIGRDGQGHTTLDSSILIRTAQVHADGGLILGVGATLVRHSDPEAEVAETRAKAAGLLAALGISGAQSVPAPAVASLPPTLSAPGRSFGTHPDVQAALAFRNASLAPFWLSDRSFIENISPVLDGARVRVLDAEDNFTAMLGHQLGALGLSVEIRPFDQPFEPRDYDLVVMGPGPGDPRDSGDRKIASMHRTTRMLLSQHVPFLAVCLGHQVLASVLGFGMARMSVPNQGVQKGIDLFGGRELVGFYNTFYAQCDVDQIYGTAGVGPINVSRDMVTGAVHALRGPTFSSFQFHPESVLTTNGVEILSHALRAVRQTVVV